jgi:hypothetical protein
MYLVSLDKSNGLGLVLADGDDDDGNFQTVVVDFSPLACGEIGPAEASGEIEIGDAIVEINGICVRKLPYEEVLGLLQDSDSNLELKLIPAQNTPYKRRPLVSPHRSSSPRAAGTTVSRLQLSDLQNEGADQKTVAIPSPGSESSSPQRWFESPFFDGNSFTNSDSKAYSSNKSSLGRSQSNIPPVIDVTVRPRTLTLGDLAKDDAPENTPYSTPKKRSPKQASHLNRCNSVATNGNHDNCINGTCGNEGNTATHPAEVNVLHNLAESRAQPIFSDQVIQSQSQSQSQSQLQSQSRADSMTKPGGTKVGNSSQSICLEASVPRPRLPRSHSHAHAHGHANSQNVPISSTSRSTSHSDSRSDSRSDDKLSGGVHLWPWPTATRGRARGPRAFAGMFVGGCDTERLPGVDRHRQALVLFSTSTCSDRRVESDERGYQSLLAVR